MVEVFFSYAHEDTDWQSKLEKHLKLLLREGLITTWNKRDITAGEDWKNVTNTHIESANVILLLISSDFIASDYCIDVELKRALERHRCGEAQVIPIILRPSDWQNSCFSHLATLPHTSKPITKWQNEDEAFVEVVNGLRKIINKIDGDQSHLKFTQVSQTSKTILMLSANPQNTELPRSRIGVKEIKNALKKSDHEDLFTLKNEMQIDASDLTQELSATDPFIIHISGCENGIDKLVLGKETFSSESDTLIADLFKHYTKNVKCVILNGCYSEEQSRKIVQYIDFVIGIGQNITDSNSILFFDEFYFQIGSKRTIKDSYGIACERLKRNEVFDDRQFIILNRAEEARKKELEEELKSYNLSLENNPNDVIFWTGKAEILRDLGLPEEADKAYEKAFSLQPENHEILAKQGDAQEQFGNHEKAVSTYAKALIIEPASYKIWWKKGKAHFAVKEYNEAIESYLMAIDLEPPLPDNYVIYREYGEILQTLGRYRESIDLYKKGLRSEPRYRVSSYEKKLAYNKEYYESK